MQFLNGKKLVVAGFFVVLLIAIPLTIFMLQKQQETRSHAEKSTTLAFAPESSQTNPIQKSVGDSVPLDIMVDPGKNQVSFVKVEISYDSTKLATDSANAFLPNTQVFPTVLEGPIYSDGKIAVTLSIGSDPTKAIQQVAKAATVTFKALAPTNGAPTVVTYTTSSEALSIGSADQASEDVLSTTTPAAITIADGGGVTSTPIPPTGVPPTDTPPPPTATPTVAPPPPSQPTTVPAPVNTNTPPSCNSLTADVTSGNAPLSVTFTATGSDTDGTVNKVTFNFGDGKTGDVTSGGGIGTASVSASMLHTYTDGGALEASAIMTDDQGGISTPCKQTITVAGAPTQPPAQTSVAPTTPPTLPATGPGNVMVALGAVAGVFTLVGGLLFFIL